MTPVLWTVGAAAWAIAGFAGLSLAMDRHRRDSGGEAWTLPNQAVMRMGGYGGLVASLSMCSLATTWTVGAASWFGAMTVAAMAVVLTLTYRPTWLVRGCVVAALTGFATSAALLS